MFKEKKIARIPIAKIGVGYIALLVHEFLTGFSGTNGSFKANATTMQTIIETM